MNTYDTKSVITWVAVIFLNFAVLFAFIYFEEESFKSESSQEIERNNVEESNLKKSSLKQTNIEYINIKGEGKTTDSKYSNTHFQWVTPTLLILIIAINSGIVGGIGGYSLRFMEDQEQGVINASPSVNPMIFLGISASLSVPLFLNLIGGGYLDIGTEHGNFDFKKILTITSFCILASISSKQFIKSITSKAIDNKMDSLDKKTNSMKSEMKELRENQKAEQSNLLILSAQNKFNSYIEIKKEILNNAGASVLELDFTSPIPKEKSTAMTNLLKQAISNLKESRDKRDNLFSLLLEANCYRQLFLITKDKNFIDKAYQCALDSVNKYKDKSKNYPDDRHVLKWGFTNLVCYAIVLKKDSSEIINLTRDAQKNIDSISFREWINTDKDINNYIAKNSAFAIAFKTFLDKNEKETL